MAEKDVSIYKSGLPVNLDNLEHTALTPFHDRKNLEGGVDDISR